MVYLIAKLVTIAHFVVLVSRVSNLHAIFILVMAFIIFELSYRIRFSHDSIGRFNPAVSPVSPSLHVGTEEIVLLPDRVNESEVEENVVVFLLVVLGPGLGLGALTEEENESLD